jgi:hypothetical protein
MLVPIWALIIVGLVVVTLAYTTINLLVKNERYEDLTSDYRSFFAALNQKVVESDKKLREADRRGLFSSDDEVGSIFTEIKSIHDSLSNFFKVEQTNGETQRETK